MFQQNIRLYKEADYNWNQTFISVLNIVFICILSIWSQNWETWPIKYSWYIIRGKFNAFLFPSFVYLHLVADVGFDFFLLIARWIIVCE